MNDNIKKTGSYYTSEGLSDFMANKLLFHMNEENENTNRLKILDPSCGEGELLKSISHTFDKTKLNLIGIDIDEKAIEIAKERIEESENVKTLFYIDDYIKNITAKKEIDTKLKEILSIDAIIANPPYVRTQNLDDDQIKKWKEHFNLAGRVDLYHVFLAAMTENLNTNGYLCAITSNRYLNTAGGKSIRKLLFENYYILEIIDLGDTKLFDAAVLPAIFIGKKKEKNEPQNNKPLYTKIYEKEEISSLNITETQNFFDIFDAKKEGLFKVNSSKKIYEVSSGILKIPKEYENYWIMASKKDLEWKQTLESKAKIKFNDLFHVKVGIKTTADKVFINKKSQKIKEGVVEPELIKPLVTSKSINEWKINPEENLEIIYPYSIDASQEDMDRGSKYVINLSSYPLAENFFNKNSDILRARKYVTESNKQWYEIWVPHNPKDWERTKIIFPDISSSAQFVVDNKGYLVNGNCYWIITKDNVADDWLYLAAGVANSSTMEKYHEIKFQNVLYSDKKRYLSQYVKNYLIPDVENKYSKQIIKRMKQLENIDFEQYKFSEFKTEIDTLVEKAFDI